MRVLIVDDDEDDYILTRDLLVEGRRNDVEVAWEADPAQALHRMTQEEWSAVMLDHLLGPVTGLQLLQQARQEGLRLPPVILLTGLGDRQVDLEAMAAGAADFLHKGEMEASRLEHTLRYCVWRHEALLAIEAQQAELKRSNVALQQFASVVSHDLRNPLHAIRGNLELLTLTKGKLDDRAEKLLAAANRNVVRMERMLEDLMVLATVQADRSMMQLVSLDALLDQALDVLRERFGAAGAVVSRSPLPVVRGQPTPLLQLFQNLLDNSLKFRGSTPLHLEVRAVCQGSRWQISLEDNGIGVPEESADEIFEVFTRLHAAPDATGSGMGLPICRSVVERHQGRIWLEQAESGGCRFVFTLPASLSVEPGLSAG
jgi:signal transduction histidine kinase